jgi:hypothetical protein
VRATYDLCATPGEIHGRQWGGERGFGTCMPPLAGVEWSTASQSVTTCIGRSAQYEPSCSSGRQCQHRRRWSRQRW